MSYRMVVFAAICLFLCIFCHPDSARAQKYPLELSRSKTDGIELESDTRSIDIQHDHASLILPILPFESFMLLVYFKEDEKKIAYREFADPVSLDKAGTPVALTDFPEKLVNSTRGVFLAIPIGDVTWVFRRDEIVATDYEEVDSDDRSFMNQILYRPISNEQGRWFYGLSHIGGIAKDAYIPLLGLLYEGDIIRINSVLPSYFILQFKLGEHGYLLIDETITAESYRLTEKDPWRNAYLTQLNLTSRLEIGVRFAGFELGVSYGLTNIHTITFNDKDHRELQKWNLKATPVTSLNFQWNL